MKKVSFGTQTFKTVCSPVSGSFCSRAAVSCEQRHLSTCLPARANLSAESDSSLCALYGSTGISVGWDHPLLVLGGWDNQGGYTGDCHWRAKLPPRRKEHLELALKGTSPFGLRECQKS